MLDRFCRMLQGACGRCGNHGIDIPVHGVHRPWMPERIHHRETHEAEDDRTSELKTMDPMFSLDGCDAENDYRSH